MKGNNSASLTLSAMVFHLNIHLTLAWLSLLAYVSMAFSPPRHISKLNSHRSTSKTWRQKEHDAQLKRSNRLVIREEAPNSNHIEGDSIQESNGDVFTELMSPISSAQPDQMSASSLAYLGDVVFELFIRSRYVWPQRRMPVLQNTVVGLVNGE